jgi:hypothetical protein
MEDAGEGPEEGGFAEARDAFEQHVAAGDHAYENAVDDLGLTDDDFADFLPDLVEVLDRLTEGAICRHLLILWQQSEAMGQSEAMATE